MPRLSLDELGRRCHKPDHTRIGTWMARRVSRPLALRVTWLIAPWGVSAGAATLGAWLAALVSAGLFALGTPGAWLGGALLLQVWYLLDHVDGQLARLHGTASLDGVQLDYLMHHTVNVLIPLGVGWGLFARFGQPGWMLGGVIWGLSLLTLGLQHDARYKAFILRLKRLRGQLLVEGGGGFMPLPAPPMPREARRLLTWTLKKLCEMHVVMNLLLVVAIIEWLCPASAMHVAGGYVALAAAVALLVACAALWRSQREAAVEQEFARWFRLPAGCTLRYDDGWWIVEDERDTLNRAAPRAPADTTADSAAP